MNNLKPIEILLVEDNKSDQFMTERAFSKGRIYNNIHIAQDGEVAMDILKQRGEYADSKRPDIVLLDINLPKKNGQEVLTEIKNDSDLKTIPVIMLSSSEAEEDIFRSYNLHANGYIPKPVDVTHFKDIVNAIEDFWFTIVRLPKD